MILKSIMYYRFGNADDTASLKGPTNTMHAYRQMAGDGMTLVYTCLHASCSVCYENKAKPVHTQTSQTQEGEGHTLSTHHVRDVYHIYN